MSRTNLISRVFALSMWFTGLAILAACDTGIRQEAADGIEEGRRLTAEERRKLNAFQRGEVIREDKPFYGAAVPVKRGSRQGKPLPRALEGARGIALKLSGQADIRTIAAAITSVSDIPVNIRTRYILDTGDVVEVPIGTRMRVDHEGTLSAFLDRLAARMDVAWNYDGTVITIDRMVRRTWRVALPLGTTTINDDSRSGATDSDTITSFTVERILDPWKDLEDRLKPLAPSPAYVAVTRQAGRVEVFGPPSVQKAVGKVLEDVTATANMRIGLDVAVYFVDTDKADEFGVGLDLATVLGSAQGRDVTVGLATRVPTGGAGNISIDRGDDSIDFEALARDRAVVDYRLASSVTQSGIISPIDITTEWECVIGTRKTTRRDDEDEDEGEDEDESDETETEEPVLRKYKAGFSVAALPRLIDRRSIQLSLTVTQRDRGDGANCFAADGGGQVAPEFFTRNLRNETLLSSGETLVLSGYEQDFSVREDSGLGPFRRIGLGGSSRASTRKVRMILMVRPTLIPQGRGGRS